MSQGDILEVLKNNGPLTEKKIAEILGVTISSVASCMRRLEKSGDVKGMESKSFSHGKEINLKVHTFCINTENEKRKKVLPRKNGEMLSV